MPDPVDGKPTSVLTQDVATPPAGAGTPGALNPNPTPPNPEPDKSKDGAADNGDGKGKDSNEPPKPIELKAPEGLEFKPESLKAFTEAATGLKLSQEQAQELVNWYAKQNGETAQAQAEAWKTTNDEWVAQAKSDKEFGGANYDTSVATAKLALTKFGTAEFAEALTYTGMGNHPEMIRFLHRVAKAFGEDKLSLGAPPLKEEPKSAAQILFPNQNT